MNLTYAFELLLRAATMGNAEAQSLVGAMYSQGLGTEANPAKAILYHTFAARASQIPSLMALAYKKYYGIGTPMDCYAAAKYYKLVAETVTKVHRTVTAVERQVEHLPADESRRDTSGSDLVQYYWLGAESGDLNARMGLGHVYLRGKHGVKQDLDQALSHFLLAADEGRPSAMGHAGAILYETNKTADSMERAFKLFTAGAGKDDPLSLSYLGLIYLHGMGVPADVNTAVRYISKAAERQQSDAQVNLGILSFTGVGVPRNLDRARELFISAVKQGNLHGRYYLGLMNLNEIPQNRVSCTLAFSMLKSVAEGGGVTTGGLLTKAHEDFQRGRYNSSAVRFLLAAERGFEEGQSNAAFLLSSAAPSTPPLAILQGSNTSTILLANLMRAGAQGSVEAKVRLGDLYFDGEVVPGDLEKAAAFYTVANLDNSAEAMFNLGYMHEHGFGVAQNLSLARVYYSKARETSEEAFLPSTLALGLLALKFVVAGDPLSFLDFGATTAGGGAALLDLGAWFQGLAEGALLFTLGLGLGILIFLRTRL